MRLFALLFALYLACLSCLPCADEVAACAEQAPTSIRATSHSEGGRPASGDWCSPLCQCHCCAGAVLTPLGVAVGAFARPTHWVAGPRHAALRVAAPTRVAGAVWQPPRA